MSLEDPALKAWVKIEEKLNLLLESLLRIIETFVAKSTPTSIKATINKRKGKPLIDVHSLQESLLKLKQKIDVIINKLTEYLGRALIFFRSLNKDSFNPEKILLALIALLSPFLGRLRDWYIALKPTTMLAMVSIATVGGLSSIVVYKQIQKISDETRSPASELVEEVENATAPSRRPAYYKKQERELRVRNVSFPVYYTGANASKKLVVDFTFVASNRYIKEYFDDFNNSHKLKDRLNTRIEQIMPDFPLTIEGKRVIKEKIIKEMQFLIDDLKIEGSIEEVHIHSIIAG